MRLSTWIVTEVARDNPRMSIHFVCASSSDRARDLVTKRTGIRPETLSVVRLREDAAEAPESQRKGPGLERYLGALGHFSPYLREPCAFCQGTGRVLGSRPPEQCSPCGGSGIKTLRI